jgi:hypothetical protein
MRWYRSSIVQIILLATLSASVGMAQTHGYLFVAPGVVSGSNNSSALIHLGVGGEYVFRSTYGAGAEVGFIGRSDLDAAGMASINGYYHFKHDRPWAPFVTPMPLSCSRAAAWPISAAGLTIGTRTIWGSSSKSAIIFPLEHARRIISNSGSDSTSNSLR